jgi:hypothetical protein
MTLQDRARGEAMAVITLLASTDADSDDLLVQRLQEIAGEPELAKPSFRISHPRCSSTSVRRQFATRSGPRSRQVGVWNLARCAWSTRAARMAALRDRGDGGSAAIASATRGLERYSTVARSAGSMERGRSDNHHNDEPRSEVRQLADGSSHRRTRPSHGRTRARRLGTAGAPSTTTTRSRARSGDRSR